MVHTFRYTHNGKPLYFLWDIESGSLLNVDYVAFLCAKNKYAIDLTPDELSDYNALDDAIKSEVCGEIDELEQEGVLNAKPQITAFNKSYKYLKAMCLHICHDCNMRCEYCFAHDGTYDTARDYMSLEVGKKAIDLLLKECGIKKNLEVDFFGGEPLLNLDVVKGIVEYAKAEAEKVGKRFSFTMTTNCLLLNDDNIAWLNEEMDNVVLSIDGRKCVHDAVRKSPTGNPNYDVVLKNAIAFRKVRGDKKYYVRGTFTAKNLDFCKDILDLNDKGFDQISIEPVVLPEDHPLVIKEEHLKAIMDEYDNLAEHYIERRKGEKWFNFFHYMIDLDHGPCVNKRLTGCGAGTEYVAVSPLGDIYPCHQFVGEEEYLLGNVYDGISNDQMRARFAKNTVLAKEHCTDCPAKYYCGGGCAANAKNFAGKIEGQFEQACILTRKRLENSLAIAYLERN
ncbi:MAG: thioether cross-link-forming SCIFF peptide maturase [Clostridia bacterium]|nr:thioether cross-link-forming SCIFF peptide maturase [Clostridia bacterium]